MRYTQMPGHGLIAEGAPHDDNGKRNNLGGVAGWGRGLCSCGDMSEHLHSARQRRAWHNQHKAEIAAREAAIKADVYAAVDTALAQLDGTTEAAVSLLTGLSREQIEELGGAPDD